MVAIVKLEHLYFLVRLEHLYFLPHFGHGSNSHIRAFIFLSEIRAFIFLSEKGELASHCGL